MRQSPNKLNSLSVKQIGSSVHKLFLNYFPQEIESFLHFIWKLNLFYFIFGHTNFKTKKMKNLTKKEIIENYKNKIEDYRNKRDKETKRRNEIQDKLEDKIEGLERKLKFYYKVKSEYINKIKEALSGLDAWTKD